ncbi:MAG: GatB/YqeY domain-containing protein [Sphaerospermopsis sp. SIO1G2]|nr:GatB/YqeY domain-containing protein [Sphaerospermopsis sp. SIO1G2]
MTILETIKADLKTAMKAKDAQTRDTLRLILTAVKQIEVDKKKELNDADMQQLLMKQAKQRRESILEYEKAGRDELAEPEKLELAVIEKYLPQMMSKEEIMELAKKVIAEVGADNPKAKGAIMGKLMPQVKGKADGRLVNEVVGELMNG